MVEVVFDPRRINKSIQYIPIPNSGVSDKENLTILLAYENLRIQGNNPQIFKIIEEKINQASIYLTDRLLRPLSFSKTIISLDTSLDIEHIGDPDKDKDARDKFPQLSIEYDGKYILTYWTGGLNINNNHFPELQILMASMKKILEPNKLYQILYSVKTNPGDSKDRFIQNIESTLKKAKENPATFDQQNLFFNMYEIIKELFGKYQIKLEKIFI